MGMRHSLAPEGKTMMDGKVNYSMERRRERERERERENEEEKEEEKERSVI